MKAASIAINLCIFVVTYFLLIRSFRKDGTWKLRHGLRLFRYFTVLSNAFCALAALVMTVSQLRGAVSPVALWLKYLGTVSVTVTLLTVFLFLGPSQGGYRDLLSGDSFYMHLVGPLLAFVSFCFIEKRDMTLAVALTGLLPVILYGAVYLYQVIYAPEDRRWEDFYGFNKGGRWPLSYGAMAVGTALLCVLIKLI